MSVRAPLSPAAARVKRVVRHAVSLIGGVDGAAVTVARGRSTVGRWMCLNEPDLPCLDSALAIDEVLVAMGKGPMIVAALALEVGHIALDVCSGEGAGNIGSLTAQNAIKSGEFLAEVAIGMADGTFTAEEKALALSELDDFVAVALRLRAALAEGAA